MSYDWYRTLNKIRKKRMEGVALNGLEAFIITDIHRYHVAHVYL